MSLVLGCFGVALGLQGVFKETEPTWIAKGMASLFVAITIYASVINYRNTRSAL